MTVNGAGKKIKVYFQYERLQDFCYACGRLGRTVRDCKETTDDKDREEELPNNYGPWLRASMVKKKPT